MKIRYAQIDPNGLCNAGCWFCPVKYIGNPKEFITQMSPEAFREIIKQISEGKGDWASEEFNGIYTSHYNEILLYRYFPEMLETLREFKMGCIILSNGTPLTPEKSDLIQEYRDVVWGVCINSPIWTDADLFAKRTAMKPAMFDKLKRNAEYASKLYPEIFTVQINGHNEESGAVKGVNFPDIPEDELAEQVEAATALFPGTNIFKNPHLIDRAGLIDDVISSENFIQDKEVIGCTGNREKEWLHINAKGDLFLCCNDYTMDYKYGNVNDNTLKEIIESTNRLDVIEKAYKEICINCTSAQYQN